MLAKLNPNPKLNSKPNHDAFAGLYPAFEPLLVVGVLRGQHHSTQRTQINGGRWSYIFLERGIAYFLSVNDTSSGCRRN